MTKEEREYLLKLMGVPPTAVKDPSHPSAMNDPADNMVVVPPMDTSGGMDRQTPYSDMSAAPPDAPMSRPREAGVPAVMPELPGSQALGRAGLPLAPGSSAMDRRDYEYGKRHDVSGKAIDRDKGKGSALKNFLKGLGIGFLRGGSQGGLIGGLAGAAVGAAMNTSRGNMDEEFAWQNWHKPGLDQAVGMEAENNAIQNAQRKAARDEQMAGIDTRGKLIQQQKTLADIEKGQQPKVSIKAVDNVLYQVNEDTGEAVKVKGIPEGERFVVKTGGREVELNRQEFLKWAEADDKRKAEIEKESRVRQEKVQENKFKVDMEMLKSKIRLADAATKNYYQGILEQIRADLRNGTEAQKAAARERFERLKSDLKE